MSKFSLLQKIEIVLHAFEKEQDVCSFEELKEKFVFDEKVTKEERFNAVVEAMCRFSITENNEVAKLYSSGGTETSLIVDMIISYLNQNVHGYQRNPFFSFAEEQIIQKVIGYVGYRGPASGIFLPGGSYSAFIAMICARHKKYPFSKQGGLAQPIQVIASSNSSCSIDDSAVMMGIGTDNIIKIDFEEVTPRQFEDIVLKHDIFMINSTFGETDEGTMESIDKYSKIIKKHKIWHHIDASEGGTTLFSSKYRQLTDAFQDADSIAINCHICLQQQSSLLLVKDGELLKECSSITTPFQCGRRADGFKLWLCDQLEDLDTLATAMYDQIVNSKETVTDDSDSDEMLEDPPTYSHSLVTSV